MTYSIDYIFQFGIPFKIPLLGSFYKIKTYMLPICHLCNVFLLGFQIKQMRRNYFLSINEGVDHCMSPVNINVVVDFDFLLY